MIIREAPKGAGPREDGAGGSVRGPHTSRPNGYTDDCYITTDDRYIYRCYCNITFDIEL